MFEKNKNENDKFENLFFFKLEILPRKNFRTQ